MKIRLLPLLVTVAAASLLVPARAGQRGEDDSTFRVRLEAANPAELASALQAAGYDVLPPGSDASTIDVVVSAAGLRAIQKSGLTVLSIEQGQPLRETLQTAVDGPMAEVALASPGYRDLDGVLARLQEIAAAYPAIAEVVDITFALGTPSTSEGRHLFALKISDNVAVDEDEPAMLIVANHHAREIGTPVIALDAAERLTTGYGTDLRITSAVDGHEIWIAPVWNPDGYNHVFTADNFWRKNRRIFANGVGVDQNRNYPQGWGASCAGSTSVSSETYKGPLAASEAETRTMMTWSERERFAKVLDYHSYGREVLYAYRCLSHPFRTWMQQEAVALSQASGYGGVTRVPSAEGEHQEWQFARMGAYAFLIETHTQFQPPYASALSEAALVWPGMLRVLERPISISGHVTDAVTGAPLAARIDITNVTFANGETNSSGGAYGAYHMFLPAGTYDVRFSLQGYSPVTSRVTVTASSAEVMEVQLSPAAPEEVIFADDFETDTGWARNAEATDTATFGLWERGDPQATSSSGPKQLGTTASGVTDLVTGRLAGSSSGANDLDGGRTSMASPFITLPSTGSLTLTFNYYFAHGSNSSTSDFLRVTIVGGTRTVVFQELGAANDDDGVWATATINLGAFAGQTVRILVEAADAGGASLVEAAIDDVKIVRQ